MARPPASSPRAASWYSPRPLAQRVTDFFHINVGSHPTSTGLWNLSALALEFPPLWNPSDASGHETEAFGDSIASDREFIILRFCEGLMLVAPIAALGYWALGSTGAAACSMFVCLCAALSRFVVCYGVNATTAVQFTIGGLWISILAGVLGSGGLTSPILVGTTLFPILAGLTIGGSAPWKWGLAGAMISIISGALEFTGYMPPPFVLPDAAPPPLRAALIVVTIAVTLLATMLQLRVYQRAHIALDQARSAAACADELKTTILRAVSHELRTPMNGILNLSEMLRETEDRTEQLELLSGLETSGSRLMGLVEDILDFVEVSSGHTIPRPTLVSPNDLTWTTLRSLAPKAQRKSLRLELGVGETVPTRILADEHQLQRSIEIVVDNAIKFTKAGSICVTVSNRGTAVRWTVTDTGPGVPEDARMAIFSLFERADTSDSRSHQGLGLGLALLSVFTNAWGGQAGFTTTTGKGSSFWFELPLSLATEPPHRVQAA